MGANAVDFTNYRVEDPQNQPEFQTLLVTEKMLQALPGCIDLPPGVCVQFVITRWQSGPGNFLITDDNHGSLQNGYGFDFNISSVGPNGHSCELSGRILPNTDFAKVKSIIDDTYCRVHFQAKEKIIRHQNQNRPMRIKNR